MDSKLRKFILPLMAFAITFLSVSIYKNCDHSNLALDLRFQVPLQHQLTYDINNQSNSRTISDHELEVNLPDTIDFTYSGKLTLTALKTYGDVLEFWGTLEFSLENNRLQIDQSPINFKLNMTARKEIVGVYFNQVDFEDRSFLVIDLLKFFQMSYPDFPVEVGQAWTYREDFLREKILVDNQIDSQSGESTSIRKLYSGKGGLEVHGQAHVGIQTNGAIIQNLEVKRNIKQSGIGQIKIDTRQEIKLKLVQSQAIDLADLSKLTAKMQANNLEIMETLDQRQFQLHLTKKANEKLIEGISTQEIFNQIEQAAENDRQSNMKIFTLLKALFLNRPDEIAKFQSFLLEYDIDDERFKLVASALTAVNNEQAERSLMEAITESQDERRQQRLIPNLGFMAELSIDAENFLHHLAENESSPVIQQTANLSLGTAAHFLRERQSNRSHAIYERYRQKLAASEDDKQLGHYIAVLGNIGLPQQVNDLSQYLASESQFVRARAYQGMRYVPGIHAEQVLLAGLQSESDVVVKELISESLTYRESSEIGLEHIQELLKKESNINIIKNLIRTLANDAVYNEKSYQFIKSYTLDCAHPDLCPFLEGVLSSVANNKK